MSRPKILWNFFHENFAESRGNKALLGAVSDLDNVTVNDQHAHYPDFKINVEREQKLLVEHDLIVFQHPFYWYSTPALMKEWEDKVLLYGFAYPPKEGKALHGKSWLSVMTSGGPDWSYRSGGYNNFTVSELYRPIQQTAYLCGMFWLPPFIVHSVLPGDYEGIKATDDVQLQEKAAELRQYIETIDLTRRHSLEPVVPPHALP